MRANKAQAAFIEPLFAVLFAGILVLMLAGVVPGQTTKIAPDLEANYFENMAILLANSLLADHNLIYSEEDIYYRSVFDKEKLDAFLITKSSLESLNNLFVCSKLCASTKSYPDSFSLIIISDIENNDGWFSTLYPINQNSEFLNKMTSCILGFDMNDASKIFTEELSKLFDLENCGFNSTTILDKGFPISIRYSDSETHMGLLKVMVIE